MYQKIQEAASYIKRIQKCEYSIGVILGSGIAGLTESVQIAYTIPYSSIPHFPVSTVEGHDGALIIGTIGTQPVLMFSGRFHYYEGYSMSEVTFPIRVLQALGVQKLFLSNAAGGMHPTFKVGDIMLITDHINLFPEHPLRGKNDERLGTRFPDMTEAYSHALIHQAKQIAKAHGIEIKEGVYAGLSGPTYETKAEYRWLHRIGADAVGMSTVPEVLVAKHAGMEVFAASIITDIGIREEMNVITHEEVLEVAQKTAPLLATLFKELIKSV